MNTRRYLIFFSYIGSNYRGVQSQRNIETTEYNTVLDAIKHALKNLRDFPTCDEGRGFHRIILASRTDKGVHAMMNSLNVDFEYPAGETYYPPDYVTYKVNYNLKKGDHQIQLLNTKLVSNEFHARKCAKYRHYIYRLAFLTIPKSPPFLVDQPAYYNTSFECVTPMSEKNRTWVAGFKEDINIDNMYAATELMKGEHDFELFQGQPEGDRSTVRTITEFDLAPSAPVSFPDPLLRNLEFWQFSIKSKSFLNRQVRRMVSAAVAVGKGNITLDDVKAMLEKKIVRSSLPPVFSAPPHGLYLVRVHYDPEDLEDKTIDSNLTSN